ncbi:MAG: hydantoinase B/oxoprolinase family protein [Actinobacteria bacterium]|nr:hydantoinase B/oxoprolinase family protein [Actinomycetota bacterium]
MSSSQEVRWDGVRNPYIPDRAAVLEGARRHLKVFEEVAEVDPVLYEVIRHSLVQLTDDHGKVIEQLSGSPITLYTNDFNAGVLSAAGEIITLGPYVQLFSAMMDTVSCWVLENRAASPGIRPGDMFISNDPWVGTLHQMDVGILAPVFNDDEELIAWVGNFAHHYDVGGTIPGSFIPNATDVFDEATPFPPTKIVAGGELLQDVEDLFLRHSRRPDIVRLDLHAQIAAAEAARRKFRGLCDRHGDATVNGVMQRVLESGEKAFKERLDRIPSGTWSASALLDGATEGDRGVYRVQGSVTKDENGLTFSNAGTDPQAGILNATYGTWRGSVATALNSTLAYDQLFAIGGAMRHVHFDPVPGTLNCASYPASVSCGGLIGVHQTLLMTHLTLGKMMSASPAASGDVLGQGAACMFPVISIAGIDANGREFGTGILDGMIGGLGAFSFRDGVDTGGIYFIPKGRAANVEEAEDMFPVLYLARREKRDSGGAGRFRGGNSFEVVLIPHGTAEIMQTTASGGVGVTAALGLSGGLPGCPNFYEIIRDTDVRAQLAAGTVVTESAGFEGTHEPLAGKSSGAWQKPDDVYAMHSTAGAGYGDPLRRDPALVLDDVENGRVGKAGARQLYGVVISAGEVNFSGTDERRDEIRRRRLESAAAPPARGSGRHETTDARALGAHLGVVRTDADEFRFACLDCGTDLGPADGDYKRACARAEVPLEEVNVLAVDPGQWVDADVVLRQFYCPDCATTLDTEMTLRGAESLRDIALERPAQLFDLVPAEA